MSAEAAAIEVDDEHVLDDYASSYDSDWTSAAGSSYDYTYENGRRYHAFRAGKYMLPNDEQEQSRLDMIHHTWNLQLGGKLICAPIKKEKLRKVLDLGTGTGIWATEIGDEYPDAQVIGVDLSPIQHTWVPPNVTFAVDDIEDAWTYKKNSFDLIHLRSMFASIKDWKHVVDEAYQALAPGGYLEIKDMDLRHQKSDDGSLKPDSRAVKYHNKFTEAIEKLGLATTIDQVIPWIRAAGFVNISHTKNKFPLAAWPKDPVKKEVGKFLGEICQIGFESYALALFTRTLEIPEAEARVLIDGARADVRDLRIHSYCDGYVVYAQKPL